MYQTSANASPFEQIFQLGSAAVIILEHSFYVFDQRRHLQDQQQSVPSVHVALERYMASPHAIAVRNAVNTAVHAYQEAVSAAVYTSQGNSSTWMAKLPFEYFQRKAKRAQAKAELLQRILEITLQYRLPRP
ncbi:hypothetical protein DEU56DRAFT_911735 [Suillus clintonianus]|uniref:uncharacterized protein n=1 Tax=Suillus clintonianus TaxID=1904413 RepID=UPI001B87EBA0|nr:uncharacterized protein DEU56DRAFT_911735 [Suillus clintonianus]KAG2140669.1 hypothetical protein DEU56DRAFT_911735 [Suillus clintonianus]